MCWAKQRLLSKEIISTYPSESQETMLHEEDHTLWNIRLQCAFDFFSHLPPETCAAYLEKHSMVVAPNPPVQIKPTEPQPSYAFQLHEPHSGSVASGTLQACHHGTVVRGTAQVSWYSAAIVHLLMVSYVLHVPVSCWVMTQAENFFWLVQGLVGAGLFALGYLGIVLYVRQLIRRKRDMLIRQLQTAIYQLHDLPATQPVKG